jgi:hypothetical protein
MHCDHDVVLGASKGGLLADAGASSAGPGAQPNCAPVTVAPCRAGAGAGHSPERVVMICGCSATVAVGNQTIAVRPAEMSSHYTGHQRKRELQLRESGWVYGRSAQKVRNET